jgi:hypothetical protein
MEAKHINAWNLKEVSTVFLSFPPYAAAAAIPGR